MLAIVIDRIIVLVDRTVGRAVRAIRAIRAIRELELIAQRFHPSECSEFVGTLVEFVEQEEEHDGMHANPPHKRPWIVAVDEQQLECVYHDGDELNLECTDEWI